MEIFLDTSFLVSLLIETKKSDRAINYFERAKHRFVTSVSVFEETLYTGVRLLTDEKLKIRGRYRLQDYIKKKGYAFAKDFWQIYSVFPQVLQVFSNWDRVKKLGVS
ncbi:MAG: PIN domain-containing protein [Candidatus Diapherotrites archaeon]|nr:PIN domain-containing protein [Candidatus Diapherotrites archaeon]